MMTRYFYTIANDYVNDTHFKSGEILLRTLLDPLIELFQQIFLLSKNLSSFFPPEEGKCKVVIALKNDEWQ